MPLLAASPIADQLFREVPKAADLQDLRSIAQGYAETAERCERGGFDGVELQCSHSSIVRQFLSPHTNQRTDEYGGSLDNRMRLLRQIIAAIRNRVAPDFVIGVRLCGDEFQPDGIQLDEAVETAVRLEQDGLIDYINTSIGVATESLFLIEASMRVPPDYAIYIPAAIRRQVNLPVVGVGRIKDPGQAERILAAGWADLVGIVRAQIADSEFARKALSGEADQSRFCLAITAQFDGHQQQELELGGQVRTAVKAPGRAEFGELVRNLTNAMYQLQVDLHLGTRVTADELLAGRFDDVIVATGARPQHGQASIPGSDAPWVHNVVDVLERRGGTEAIGPGHRVLVIDAIGFHDSTGVAEALAERGATVEIVSSSLYVAGDLGTTLDYEHWMRRMGAMGVTLTPDTIILGIGDHTVDGMEVYTGEARRWENVDAVILAYPAVADDELYRALKGRHPSLQRAGDCVTPRRAHAAIIEGNAAGRGLGSARLPADRVQAPSRGEAGR